MIDWSKYGLRELPFAQTKVINVNVRDERLNGKLFCEDVVKESMTKLRQLVDSQLPMIYVSSSGEVLGTGKSTVLAATYWELKEAGQAAVWIQTTGFLSTTAMIAQLYDNLIADGYILKLKKKLDANFDAAKVGELLGKSLITVQPGLRNAVYKVLNSEDEDAARTFANIRRSTWVYGGIDVLGAILMLMESIKVSRFYFFIDQFEEYVLHTPSAKLANDINDLLRACNERATILVTMHPDAEAPYIEAGGSYVQSLAPINVNTKVDIPPLDENKALVLAKFYLSSFRTKDFNGTSIYPFQGDVIRYLAYKTKWNTRDFLTAFRNALMQGAHVGYPEINGRFISDKTNHQQVLGVATNEWQKFTKQS